MSSYQFILTTLHDRVGHIQLNRPDKLNALTLTMLSEIRACLKAWEADDAIACVVISGNEKAFAAGADIGFMAQIGTIDMVKTEPFWEWDQIRLFNKPLIAAVTGFALGGGCELALSCDMILASETAKFGQPEINIGVIPGAGGTQRIARAAGKAIAMELVLTGRQFTAQEALAWGLVNSIHPAEQVLEEAFKLAHTLSQKPAMALKLGKEAILKTYETGLEMGLTYERHLFHLLFSSADKQEGMAAFLEKRSPNFTGL